MCSFDCFICDTWVSGRNCEYLSVRYRDEGEIGGQVFATTISSRKGWHFAFSK